MKRKVCSFLLACLLVFSAVVIPANAMTDSQIRQQIIDTYEAALKKAGRTSFYGYCATYVNWQLVILGINKSYVSGNGNKEFDNYKNKSESTGGYTIIPYSADSYGSLKSILNRITSNGTVDVYNILVGYEKGPGSDGASYGHTTFIHAIIKGTVYASESFDTKVNGVTVKEGQPIVTSISNYCDKYPSSSYELDGVIHFLDHPVYKLYCHNNYSGKNYLYGTGFTGALNSDIIYSRDESVATVSTDQTTLHDGHCSLKIVNTAAGASGKDLAIVTLTNDREGNGWVADNKEMTLSFWAKASNANTNIYFRWGYGGYNSVTLTQNWAYYTVPMNKAPTYGSAMHPYVDRAGTVWLSEMQLEDGTEATPFAAESVKINYDILTQSEGSKYQLPSPDPTRDGYIFDGWYTAKYGGEKITEATTVKPGVMIVYAHWMSKDCAHTYVLDREKPATCVEDGEKHYTCSLCGDSYTETVPALGHECTAYEKIMPTCTTGGYTTYFCSRCDYSYTTDEAPALGHNWGTPSYVWAADNSTVTATRVCARNESHTETETVNTTSKVTRPATETAEGELTYTAIFTNPAFATQTKTVAIPKLEPTPTDPAPTDPAPTDPEPTEPTPTDPAPTDPEPTDPTPTDPEPTDPEPTDPKPTEPAAHPADEYPDVNKNDWFYGAADYIIGTGYMGSTSQTEKTFEPMTKVSRAMVASILYRICGAPADVAYQGTFTDVPEGQWFTTAIEWCAQNGLASGKGNGTFDPNGNVTRQELAVFMYKLADYLEKDVSATADLSAFPDGSTVPNWAAPYLKWAVGAGLITGKGLNGTTILAPTDTAMRCELASILQRFLSK